MVDYLLANTDHIIYGLVRRTANPNTRNIAHNLANPRFKLLTADLSDYQSIEAVIREQQPDYFINFAAQSFVGSSWQIPEQTFDVVAMGVLRCLEAIRKHAKHCRFYSAGSSEEMGDVQYSPQDINHPIRPRSPYGAAKAAARHITKVYRESYGLYAIHSILYNHESERRGEEFVSRKIAIGVARIAKAIKEQKTFEPIELGNLDAKRDWSYAPDFVEGVWRMLNQETHAMWPEYAWPADATLANQMASKHIKEYVLSSGETHPVREFVEKAFDAAGFDSSRIWAYQKTNLPIDETYQMVLNGTATCLVRINPEFYRPAEVDLLLGDSTPARTELGWTPKVSFNELVSRMVSSELNFAGL